MWNGAQWIWKDGEILRDETVDFITTFEGGSGTYRLLLSAVTDYNVLVNGTLAAFGQYADYPSHKIYDDIDLSPFVREGTNEMRITVWYEGEDTQTHLAGEPGLIFEVLRDGVCVSHSSEGTFCRRNPNYAAGERTFITGQLGLTWHYDAAADWAPYAPSRVQPDRSRLLFPRPLRKTVLRDRLPFLPVQMGSYRYTDGEGAGQRMAHAVLHPTGTLRAEPGDDGVYLIADVGEETAGFLDFDLTVPCACHADIGYGEHLLDGRCRTDVREFSAQYELRRGRNGHLHAFRRLGCRYVQIFLAAPEAEIAYLGIRPTEYPLTARPFTTGDRTRDRIDELCVRTLRTCLHEHYEDCPWREQALYTLDSRNQMLCGYAVFGEKEAARASLELISCGVRQDGLLSLCFPAGRDLPIPSYTMAYLLQMKEYAQYTGDLSLASEKYGLLSGLIRTFSERQGADGLIPRFPDGQRQYWNFYEWVPGLDGHDPEESPETDALLNAWFSLGLQSLATLADMLGNAGDAGQYRLQAELVNRAVFARFYSPEHRVFLFTPQSERIHVTVNALCMLCGAADSVDAAPLVALLKDNGRSAGAVPASLCMNGFRYDALLRCSAAYAPQILSDIDRIYGRMLEAGATSVWETEGGADDFDGAGSLCHGWSALPSWYYRTLLRR